MGRRQKVFPTELAAVSSQMRSDVGTKVSYHRTKDPLLRNACCAYKLAQRRLHHKSGSNVFLLGARMDDYVGIAGRDENCRKLGAALRVRNQSTCSWHVARSRETRAVNR